MLFADTGAVLRNKAQSELPRGSAGFRQGLTEPWKVKRLTSTLIPNKQRTYILNLMKEKKYLGNFCKVLF